MKIGIDLDGVVFNTEMLWSTYAELYDCIELNRNSVITNEEPRFQERYDWTEENKEAFLDKYADITEFDMMPGAKQVISMLKEEGHELVVIQQEEQYQIKQKEQALQHKNLKMKESSLTSIIGNKEKK